jgi:hypothetical protein
MRILFTGGVGDVLALECYLPPEDRRRVTEIVWATRRARPVAALWASLPASAYPALEKHTFLDADWSSFWAFLARSQAEARFPAFNWTGVEDWSIMARFPLITAGTLTDHGSSFLAGPAPAADPTLPGRYVLVQSATPANPAQHRAVRDFGEGDWANLLARLEAHGLDAVLVDGDASAPAPTHPRLHDRRGLTDLAGSIALLRSPSCVAYWGIDSWLAALAARHFPAEALLIRSRNPQYLRERAAYLGPRAGDADSVVVKEIPPP